MDQRIADKMKSSHRMIARCLMVGLTLALFTHELQASPIELSFKVSENHQRLEIFGKSGPVVFVPRYSIDYCREYFVPGGYSVVEIVPVVEPQQLEEENFQRLFFWKVLSTTVIGAGSSSAPLSSKDFEIAIEWRYPLWSIDKIRKGWLEKVSQSEALPKPLDLSPGECLQSLLLGKVYSIDHDDFQVNNSDLKRRAMDNLKYLHRRLFK